jgi:hypothetical protein
MTAATSKLYAMYLLTSAHPLGREFTSVRTNEQDALFGGSFGKESIHRGLTFRMCVGCHGQDPGVVRAE